MDIDSYWALVDRARADVDEPTDVTQVTARLIDLLVAAGPERCVAAGEEFDTLSAAAYGWPLWGAAYVINGFASDDGFDYFIGWLIGRGRQVFDSALAEPDSLADFVTEDVGLAECEDMLYAPTWAYERLTGNQLPIGNIIERPALGPSPNFDDRAEMRRRYPRLTEIFF